MDIILTFLIYIVALEHLAIMGLEMWGRPETQSKTFGMPLEFVRQVPAQKALANQGIYNGMVGVSLLISQWVLNGRSQLITTAIFLIFIVVVALFGSLTVKKEIFWLQGMPSLVTLLVLLTLLI
ncbi:DUF1304 domain-containing protein [Levilactobacillus huananensis]|uniref:DUF1304 domain-containing protein n=1 Tax=Levilactobacillus huananensis TaxID=2486019 RepID=UPI000F7B47A3|nr:DUF1304 domain-containing protein [Levilactobacillus huananensis]